MAIVNVVREPKGVDVKMDRKNEVIIDDLTFYVNNFNGTGLNYRVHVYAQDVEESDQYSCTIQQEKESNGLINYDLISTLYFDSTGGMTDDRRLDNLEDFIMNLLFVKSQHGIIRGF